MITKEYAMAYTEVIEILKYVPDEDVQKIPNEKLEFFGPNLENTVFQIDKIYDELNNELDAARHPKQILKIKVPFELNPFDMIRKVL